MSNVDHPSHYNKPGKKECIELMKEKYGGKVTAIFCLTNAFKYLYRAGDKIDNSEEQDIAKARWYVTYVKNNIISSVTGKYVVKLFTDVDRELQKYD